MLALAVDRDAQTIYRWLQNEKVPSAHEAYQLALTCGLSEEEALELAKECFPVAKAG